MVRKKKEVVKPVVAKPLNDIEKRNIINNFVTSNITSNGTDSDIKSDAQNETNNNTNEVTDMDTNNEIDIVNNNDTKIITENTSNSDANKRTKNNTKNVTKVVSKKIMITKSITIGKKDIIAKFTSNEKQRPNYNLSEDTIEKIEKVSEILGYKKAEFVDIYLNGTLEKVLKDLKKNK